MMSTSVCLRRRLFGCVSRSIPAILILAILASCQPAIEDDELPVTLFRRSVLDQQPRMLTLAYGNNHYLAYDLKKMNPKKLWHGGVLWHGAVFDRTKTVQPTSWGDEYDSFDEAENWNLLKGNDTIGIDIQFNSYQIINQRIQFNYTIMAGGYKIKLQETPILRKEADTIIFERNYDIVGMPVGISLFREGKSISDQSSITTHYPITATPAQPQTITSDNGAQYWLDKSGCTTCHHMQDKMIGPSYVAIANSYAGVEDALSLLVERVQTGSVGQWGDVPMIAHPNLDVGDVTNMVKYILSLEINRSQPKKAPARKKNIHKKEGSTPGFGAPVTGVHPAYDLITIRPETFKPKVGGMCFMPNGNLLVSAWDSIGAIYRLSNLEKENPSLVQIDTIATGLAEPLGLTHVGEDIFVLQKHELTQLIDHNEDGRTDEYVCVNNQFGVTADFHEFSYGLVYQNGRFYGGLGLAMRLMASERQLEDRGTVFSVSNTEDFEIIAHGLRQTNGIGIGPDSAIFVTDNQGQWAPGCKLIHVKPGAFYGCQHGTGDRYENFAETAPAVWLPQDEVGNSPSEPILMQDGPYVGQLIFGDVTHGGIKRAYLEKRNGEFQGCVFRFSQGLEAGVNRLAYGPDGDLYVGGVGMNGGWSHKERRFGLQKLKYNNEIPFEMISVSSLEDGFEIKLTAAVNKSIQLDQSQITIHQWYYKATAAYGGPKLGLENLVIKQISLSEDRTTVKLEIDGLKEGHVIYIALSDKIKSSSGASLWSGEAWYTLNNF